MIKLRWLIVLCVLGLVAAPTVSEAQTCPAVTGNFSQIAEVSARLNSCIIEDGMYVKTSTTYKLHVAVEVTGWCQTYARDQYGVCVPTNYYVRTAANTTQYVNSASAGPVFGNIGVQNYNTCGNGNCTPVNSSPGNSWSPFTAVGTKEYTSVNRVGGGTTGVGSQYCNMSGFEFPEEHSLTMHALKCEPKWETGEDPYDPADALLHFPQDEIQIYTTLSGNGLPEAIEAAADNWSGVLGDSDVSFVTTTTDCETAANCLKITSASVPGYCAQVGASWDSAGEITGNAQITLHSDWTTYGQAALERIITHEIGHLLGLDNQPGCAAADSIMRDGLACNSSTLTSPTANNYIPVNRTTYGGGPRTSCGF